MIRFLLLSASILACASPARALGQVVLFHGQPAGTGDVRAYDEATGALVAAPPELAGVLLLQIEAAGRTALEEFLPDKPRRLTDVAGASRLLLPQQQGSLYRFARGAAGARVFGYFQIDREGVARVLLERAALPGDLDPFLDRVAIAPDGRAFLCATLTGAGGDLLEVRHGSDPVQVVDRTAGAPPLRFSARGLALTSSHAWALSGRGLLRAARSHTGLASLVGFGGVQGPSFYQGDLVTSPGGTAVAFNAGSGATALHAFTVGATGPARRASTLPGTLTGAGTLPENIDGPYLAVSDDAGWCAWRAVLPHGALQTRECLAGRAAPPAGEVPEMLSSDARFLDTLDEVAVFFFRGPGQLVFAVGERSQVPAEGIENLDLFRATLSPGGVPAIENLTLTSGDSTVPFLAPPTLSPTRWVLTPDRQSLLMHDDQGQSGAIVALDSGAVGLVTLLPDAKSIEWVELAGNRYGIGLQRSNGNELYEVRTIATDLSGGLAFCATSPDTQPTTSNSSRSDGWISWLRHTIAGPVMERLQLPGTAVQAFGPPSSIGPGVGWTSGGALTFGTPGALQLWGLPGGPSATWPVGSAFQVLPGT